VGLHEPGEEPAALHLRHPLLGLTRRIRSGAARLINEIILAEEAHRHGR
jgi:hypothetical protein